MENTYLANWESSQGHNVHKFFMTDFLFTVATERYLGHSL